VAGPDLAVPLVPRRDSAAGASLPGGMTLPPGTSERPPKAGRGDPPSATPRRRAGSAPYPGYRWSRT